MVVFARVPEPGRVKTRLAATIGDDAACEVYRAMGAHIVSALTRDEARPYDVRVSFTPREGEGAMRAWLPSADSYGAQVEGDLGVRMAHEVSRAFGEGWSAVVLVGTDCLAVDGARVRESLDALTRGCDAVIGPAHDGGYYLLAMSRELPVFEGVPWSTEVVAEVTRARLRGAGVRWSELAVERDVDTAEDLAAVGWRRGE